MSSLSSWPLDPLTLRENSNITRKLPNEFHPLGGCFPAGAMLATNSGGFADDKPVDHRIDFPDTAALPSRRHCDGSTSPKPALAADLKTN